MKVNTVGIFVCVRDIQREGDGNRESLVDSGNLWSEREREIRDTWFLTVWQSGFCFLPE